VCWLIATFVAPQTDRAKLIDFYKRVHPAGPGWEKVRQEANVTRDEAILHGDHMGLATLGWISGCAVIWSSLFSIGNFLYGRLNLALLLLVIFIASGLVLLYVIRNLWSGGSHTPIAGKSPPISESVAK
jgi:SSS family solute:Na+ symporter